MLSSAAAMTAYTAPRLSDEQMRAIESCIWNSPDARAPIKPLLVWMLRQSENFTRPVALSIWSDELPEDRVRDFQFSVHDMVSSNGKTHLDRIFQDFGTEMRFDHHGGGYEKIDDKWTFKPRGHARNGKGTTVWICWDWYGKHIPPTILTLPDPELLETIRP